VLAWQKDYVGRGYLRFPSLGLTLPGPAGDIDVLILRAGPSRVEIRLDGAGEPSTALIDEIAHRIRGLVVVYCQAPIVDFNLGCDWTIDDDGELHQNAWVRVLEVPISHAAVVVPFEHMTDMSEGETAGLEQVLATGKAVRPTLLDDIQHSLTRAEGDVESFLANYAVLESVLGGDKSAVDSFIQQEEPEVEAVTDSRKNLVTIYTRLRNAKGHPTGMPPGEASTRIHELLPGLRRHVRTALIQRAMH
jgi:hypothetical protein